ncbi:P-loop containing nucleoside triphosphate hydrolase protein [Scheffersomyces xylosifermentans]|uniref:P-loop containing nucleoside triphosphate hydrolase protein n=1 Tax=Scheffersomyces xylosifermentans TaxID=1304137 RepID=UPI00315D3F61
MSFSSKSLDDSFSSNDSFDNGEPQRQVSPFNYLSPATANATAHLSLTKIPVAHNNIKVICRFRPPMEWENSAHGKSIVTFPNDQSVSLQSKELATLFTFDRVFGPYSTQADIYQFSISETVDDLLNGYNGTILAYGQTGGGKSYTMMGSNKREEHMGITPRISQEIFNRIANGSTDIEYTVGVSYFEIHMEQIRDLIDIANNDDPNHKFSIHEDKLNGVHVKGLAQAFVSSVDDLLDILNEGLRYRTTNSTLSNSESSRSHAIVQINLSQKHSRTDVTKKSRLFLVDLAGSEKVDKTGAQGQTLEEAKKINSSLSALGNVINALTDGKSTHIPYRDSKLTRILQESLGGNSRTSLIINCSPSSVNEAETLSTLRFGTRAKNIKNVAHVNTELSTTALKQKIASLEKINDNNMSYIRQLEAELAEWRAGEKPQFTPKQPTAVGRLSMRSPRTPTKDFSSRLPMPTASTPSKANSLLHDELARKDKKLEDLENTILGMKMKNLRNSHTEESKLFSLENSLHNIGNKLNDVELININLRKHLLISEKIIESRDIKINKLKSALKEQQLLISRETLGFRNKLGDIQMRLEQLNKQKQEELNIRRETLSWEKEKERLQLTPSLYRKSLGTPQPVEEIRDSVVSGNDSTSETLAEAEKENHHGGFSINSSKSLQWPDSPTEKVRSLKTISIAGSDITSQSSVLNFHQEYVSINEFLKESRRRSNMIQNTLDEVETSETSGMFHSETTKSPKGGLNLRIVKPLRGGGIPNPIHLFH